MIAMMLADHLRALSGAAFLWDVVAAVRRPLRRSRPMLASQVCDVPHFSFGVDNAQSSPVPMNIAYRFSSSFDASERGGSRPRRLRPSVMIWLTRSPGAVCDACGKAIREGESQYEVVANDKELRLDRDCFRRRMDELV